METMTKPFAMLFVDELSRKDRGFKPFPTKWVYDPKAQTSNVVTMGGTLVLSSVEECDSDTESDSEDE